LFNISTEEPSKQKWKINPYPDTKNKNNVNLKILQKPPPHLPLPPLMSTRVDITTSCNKHQLCSCPHPACSLLLSLPSPPQLHPTP